MFKKKQEDIFCLMKNGDKRRSASFIPRKDMFKKSRGIFFPCGKNRTKDAERLLFLQRRSASFEEGKGGIFLPFCSTLRKEGFFFAFFFPKGILVFFGFLFLFINFLRVAEATSNTRQMCAIPRSLARGHDKSCDPRHGTKISLILKGANDPRIRD